MKRRCKGGVACEPTYAEVELRMTMEEWLIWAVPQYERFAVEHPQERPNVSRSGDKGHYQLGNVQIVSVGQNRKEEKCFSSRRPKSQETRQKIGDALRGRKLPPISEQHRQNLRDAAKAAWVRRKQFKSMPA